MSNRVGAFLFAFGMIISQIADARSPELQTLHLVLEESASAAIAESAKMAIARFFLDAASRLPEKLKEKLAREIRVSFVEMSSNSLQSSNQLSALDGNRILLDRSLIQKIENIE